MNSLQLKHDKTKAAREQLRRDLKSRRMSRVSQGWGLWLGLVKLRAEMSMTRKTTPRLRAETAAVTIWHQFDDDDHGHK